MAVAVGEGVGVAVGVDVAVGVVVAPSSCACASAGTKSADGMVPELSGTAAPATVGGSDVTSITNTSTTDTRLFRRTDRFIPPAPSHSMVMSSTIKTRAQQRQAPLHERTASTTSASSRQFCEQFASGPKGTIITGYRNGMHTAGNHRAHRHICNDDQRAKSSDCRTTLEESRVVEKQK